MMPISPSSVTFEIKTPTSATPLGKGKPQGLFFPEPEPQEAYAI